MSREWAWDFQFKYPLKKSRKRLLGCPISIGLRRKVENKYINRYLAGRFYSKRDFEQWMGLLADFKVGDLVVGCSCLNERIQRIEPVYVPVGRHGYFLNDIDLVMESGTSCSVMNCGVTAPLTYEEAKAALEEIRQDPSFSKSYSNIVLNSDGTYHRVSKGNDNA